LTKVSELLPSSRRSPPEQTTTCQNDWIMKRHYQFFWLVAVLVVGPTWNVAQAANRPNVLLILVDDLKPALGCYGDSVAQTPNIDRLAARAMRFDLAFCNQAVCAPSRFTLMLGSHSTSTGLYGLGSRLRQVIPDAVTLPQHFAKHGYRTESLGKVFHIGHGNEGDPDSFSVTHFHDKVIEYLDPESTDGGQLTREEAYFTNQRLGEIGSRAVTCWYQAARASSSLQEGANRDTPSTWQIG
jgi:iduronate 2-sulfatase